MTSLKKSAQKQLDLSIVIPAYFEEKRIGDSLDVLALFLKQDSFFKNKGAEVIVVAADAPDITNEIVESKLKLFEQCILLKPGPHVGKGRDVQFGMLHAKGKYIVYMDADLATPLHHLEELYNAIEHGSDIAIGTRDLFHYRTSQLRNMFSGFGNRLYQLVSGIHIEDTQCGFKMFSHKAAQLCFSKLSILGWGFDLDVLAIAKANHLSITPIRIGDWKDKPYSTYTDGAMQISGRMVRDFVHITINRLRGVYLGDK